jgi:hypothetical protein
MIEDGDLPEMCRSEQGGVMTALTDRPDQVNADQLHQVERRNRLLTITVVVLVLAAVGLGSWIIYDATTDREASVTAEIDQLLDDYISAVSTNDAPAYLAVVTDDFVVNDILYYQVGGTFVRGLSSETLDLLVPSMEAAVTEWQFELVGDPIVTGEGPWYVSLVENARNTTEENHRYVGVSTYVVVDDDGTLLVAEKTWVGARLETE